MAGPLEQPRGIFLTFCYCPGAGGNRRGVVDGLPAHCLPNFRRRRQKFGPENFALTSRVLVERKLVVEGEVEVIRERVVAIKFW